MFISDDDGFLQKSERLYPGWSLILVFLLTLFLCVFLAVFIWMCKKCRGRINRRKSAKNSGKVSVGRRTTVKSLAETNFTSQNDVIPRGNRKDSPPSTVRTDERKGDREGKGLTLSNAALDKMTQAKTRALYPLIIARTHLSRISLASGAYASVSSYERKDQKLVSSGPVSCRSASDSVLPKMLVSPAAKSSGSEPSYFTPVFRRQSICSQRRFSTPGSLLFSDAVIKHLSSAPSSGDEDGESPPTIAHAMKSTGNEVDLGIHGVNKAQSEGSIHQVIDIGNNNCTYLTFNDISVIITPPFSSANRRTMVSPLSQPK